MKVKIKKCSRPDLWYSNRIGESFDVVRIFPKHKDFDLQGIDEGVRVLIKEEDCEVVGETKENMKQIKMSIDTAREMYKDSTISTKNWLLENFTKEELEPKKGFTWEESWTGCGHYIDTTGRIVGIGNEGMFNGAKAVFKTREQAESSLAFAQLTHIVAKYNEGKEIDRERTHNVRPSRDSPLDVITSNFFYHLEFYSIQDAYTSMEVNRELWEKYWMIKKD